MKNWGKIFKRLKPITKTKDETEPAVSSGWAGGHIMAAVKTTEKAELRSKQ